MGTGAHAFDADQWVLLWPLDEGQYTAEGIGTGSPLDRVLAVYPDAEDLPAPAGATGALLVSRPDRAYLVLHDGATVQRILAGTEELLRAAVPQDRSAGRPGPCRPTGAGHVPSVRLRIVSAPACGAPSTRRR
ncbi:MAG: hypothetical protein WCA46_15795 [Actinocatenispora sp.]